MDEYETGPQYPISAESLRDADRETQLEVMEAWFRERFEDPAERTPYESAEGGYIWIWGGPHDAREELEDEFGGVVPDEVIDELIEKLEGECYQWAPTSSSDDYDNYLIEDISRITQYYHNFAGAILDIEKLLETAVHESLLPAFYRMLFVNAITALETYLSDAFINTVANTSNLMRRFIETTPEFQMQKVALSEVFNAIEGIEQKARSYLIDIVWHHLYRVKPMYRATLDIEFPDNAGPIFKAVLRRHDIVHRNGKTKLGQEIIVTRDQIVDLIKEIEAFVQHIDKQLASKREGMTLNQESAASSPYTLDGLLAGVTEDNLHAEVSTGSSMGSEVW